MTSAEDLASPGSPVVEIRMLGPLEVTVDGIPLTLGGPRQRTVLALLAVNAGRVVSVDALSEAVWGDAALDRSKGTLQVYISNLRRLLAPAGDVVIERRNPGYLLRPDGIRTDAARFEAAVEAAGMAVRGGDLQAAAARFEQALVLCRGELVADLPDVDALEGNRARFHERRLTALEDRIDVQLELAGHAALVAELGSLVDEHPFRERLTGQLMLALYRSGQQAQALRAFADARLRLRDELGLDPGPELQALEIAILDHASWAQAPVQVGPALHWVDSDARARRLELDPGSSPISVGRSTECALAIEGDVRVSRDHARIVHRDTGWHVVDEGHSTNGTSVNGELVGGDQQLVDGDLLRFGDTIVLVRLGGAPPPRAVDGTTVVRSQDDPRREVGANAPPGDSIQSPQTRGAEGSGRGLEGSDVGR